MIQQVVLDKAEVCAIIAQHVAQGLPPGMNANASVQLWGSHPKQREKRSKDYIREKYLGKAKDEKPDLRLLEAGAIVTLTPSP